MILARSQQPYVWVGAAILIGIAAAWLPLMVVGGVLGFSIFMVAFLLEPTLALIVMLCIAPLKTLIETEAGLPLPLDIGQIGLMLFIGVWFLRQSIEKKTIFLSWQALIPVALFTLAASLSLWTAYSVSHSITELLKWLQILLLMILIPNLRRDRWIVFGIILSGVLQAIIGIWEFSGGSGAAHLWILDYRYFRAFGTFGQPNPFGGFMGMVLAFAVGVSGGSLLSACTKRHRSDWLPGLLYSGMALILLAGLLVSWSRGAWLGFMGAVAIMIIAMPRQRWQGFVLIASGMVMIGGLWSLGLLPASLTDRLIGFSEDFTGVGDVRGAVISDENFAVVERLAHWQSALEMAKTSPWLGVGFNNYEVAYPQHALINWEYPLGHAHNYYLNLLAETGLIGLSAYLLMWGLIFSLNWRMLSQITDWHERGIAVGLLGVWTHIAIHSLIDKLYVNNLFLHAGAMLGLLAVLHLREKKCE